MGRTVQNPCAASQQGGERPSPGPHASGLHTGRALGSSKGEESSKEQLPPSLPACLSCRAGVPQVLLLLLPPIYRDGRRRQVTDVLSRPRSLPSNVPVTLPFQQSPPLPKGWMPCSAGTWAGCTQSPPCRDPHPPRLSPGLSLVQLPGLPAPESEAEPRAVCGTANSGMAVTPQNLFPMAVTPQTPQNLLHMQGMGP